MPTCKKIKACTTFLLLQAIDTLEQLGFILLPPYSLMGNPKFITFDLCYAEHLWGFKPLMPAWLVLSL